jgi:CheY-like chemotaxis protein
MSERHRYALARSLGHELINAISLLYKNKYVVFSPLMKSQSTNEIHRCLEVVGATKMLRFLVIEDEFFVAAHIENLLNDDGLEVIGPVGTLDEATLLARNEKLDGALLDVNLDGGRVDDVADILTRRNVPFLFVTAYGRDNLPPSYREAVVVHKPFNDADLLREVRLLTPQCCYKFA